MAYVNGAQGGLITKGFAAYEHYAPPELLESTPRHETPYQRIVRRRIERSLPPQASEESAFDKRARERAERRWEEARAKAKAKPRLTPSAQQQPPTADLDARITAAINELVTKYVDPIDDEIGTIIGERTSKVRDEYLKANRKLEKRLAEQQSEVKQLRTELAIQKAMVRSLQTNVKDRPKATTLHSVHIEQRAYRASLFFEDGHAVDFDLRPFFEQFYRETTP